ncbi:MAG: beta-lactamase family protein [Defluviitaleaceae bacterium]|nr:beta-lactamase family protein [Defluviitaleaceae bacterium]
MIFTQGKVDVEPHEVGYDEGRLDVLNRHFQSIIDDGLIQCAMYCFTRHGKVFAHGAVGKRSFRAEDTTPAQPDDVRWLASMTKVITATAIMKLVEDGLVRLNSPVRDFLPQFDTPPYNAINLLHLLTHTSGLHADSGVYENKYQHGYWSLMDNALKNHKKEDGDFDWLTAALGVIGSGVRTRPNEEWSYSSFGYMVLGEVISKVTGQFAHDYIMQNIIEPLGMNDTCFKLTPELARRSIICNKYVEKDVSDVINGTVEPSTREIHKMPGTSGAMIGTAYDMTLFGNLFLGRSNSRILGRKGIEAMLKQRVNLPNKCWGANANRSYCAGFDMRLDEPFLFSESTVTHEGAGASALHVDPQEDMVAAWFVPFTENADWVVQALFNTINVIWSGLK